VEKELYVHFHVVPPLPTSSSSSELLAEKSGLVRWEMEDRCEGGRGYLRPPCLQMRNISTRRCPNPLRFLVFDSETGDEPVSHQEPHAALRKTV
jgi:hypothetical protein